MICEANHPEIPGVTCVKEGAEHHFHFGFSGSEPQTWINPDFVVGAVPIKRQRGKTPAQTLADAIKRVEPEKPSEPAPSMEDLRGRMSAGGARAARDMAMAQVDAAADGDWRDRARAMLRYLAERQEEITADDLWKAGLEKPREARALGPVFTWAAKGGLIEKTSRFTLSEQVNCHRMPRAIWRSLVFQAPVALRDFG